MTQQTVEPIPADETLDRTTEAPEPPERPAPTRSSKQVLPRFLPGYYLG